MIKYSIYANPFNCDGLDPILYIDKMSNSILGSKFFTYNSKLTLDMVLSFVYYEIPNVRQTMYQAIFVLNTLQNNISKKRMCSIIANSEIERLKELYSKYADIDASEQISAIKNIFNAFSDLGYYTDLNGTERGCLCVIPL